MPSSIKERQTTVRIYENGSFEPDSSSSSESVLSLRDNLRLLRMEKTEAASVEPMTLPSNKDSRRGKPRAI